MAGLANGYLLKIKNTSSKTMTKNELIRCENQVNKHLHKAYPRLKGRISSTKFQDSSANKIGENAGRNLTINPAFNSNSK